VRLQQKFEHIGGAFVTPFEEFKSKLLNTHSFIFDWDGVFNDGTKASLQGSPFSEVDSMGLNMLRFSYWLTHGALPWVAIITGANNLTALEFAKREHLNATILKAKDKAKVISKLAKKHNFKTEESLFVFDDILDLGAAKLCNTSICVQRSASPLFNDFLSTDQFCDYKTGSSGGKHAVRELCELLIGLYGNYDEVVQKRMAFEGDYANYLHQRNQTPLVTA